MTTNGVEASIALQPAAWLRAELDYSHVDASFNRGTDYPGVSLVPWVDGNALARVPPTSWHVALILEPKLALRGWSVGTRADLSYQDDMYENQIESFHFGKRTLFDAQLWARRGAWSVELWGRTLSNQRYVESAPEIDGSLFPTTPIPVDLFAGDGRRMGLTIGYSD